MAASEHLAQFVQKKESICQLCVPACTDIPMHMEIGCMCVLIRGWPKGSELRVMFQPLWLRE